MKNLNGSKMTYHELVGLIEQISQHTILHSEHSGTPIRKNPFMDDAQASIAANALLEWADDALESEDFDIHDTLLAAFNAVGLVNDDDDDDDDDDDVDHVINSEIRGTPLQSAEIALAKEVEWREQAEESMRGYAEEASELRVTNEDLEGQLKTAVTTIRKLRDENERLELEKMLVEVVPRWPTASHFKDWAWAPLTISAGSYGCEGRFERTKVVDLYWCLNGGRSKGEFLIGIQMSSKDGDYFSPYIETGNSLHSCYKDRPWVVEAYRIACKAMGILPQWYEVAEQQLIPMQEIPYGGAAANTHAGDTP
jgi:hypothetical protein